MFDDVISIVKATGATAGATNGVYYAASVSLFCFQTVAHNCDRYKYFEKVRILEGKKKTEKRKKNEAEYSNGLSKEDRRRVWVYGPA
jgi:hypothetical protein